MPAYLPEAPPSAIAHPMTGQNVPQKQKRQSVEGQIQKMSAEHAVVGLRSAGLQREV